MNLFGKKDKAHDHLDSEVVLEKLNQILQLLCDECGPAAQAKMHPKDEPKDDLPKFINGG